MLVRKTSTTRSTARPSFRWSPTFSPPRSTRPISNLQNIPGVALLGGRYLENLDNERYVGSVAWRQNDQTFDGAKATITAVSAVTGLYAYIGNVNRIFSDESPVGNVASNTHLFHLESRPMPIGTLTGYTYLIDLFDLDPLSNASYGGFLKGKQSVGHGFEYQYRLEYARQTNYGDNPVDYEVNYARIEQGLSWSGFTTALIYELLGSDNGVAAFQTPLATGHIFNGLADVFLVTPPTGLQDFYVEAKHKVPPSLAAHSAISTGSSSLPSVTSFALPCRTWTTDPSSTSTRTSPFAMASTRSLCTQTIRLTSSSPTTRRWSSGSATNIDG